MSNSSCDDVDRTPDFVTIKGMEYSTKLTELQLFLDETWNDEDIIPLRHMNNLTKLGLNTDGSCDNHNIRDLGPVSALASLTDLWVCNVDDLTPISVLTNLTKLGLSGIRDIGPISSLRNLTKLILDDCVIDITPIIGLTKLTELHLGSQVDDITPLSNFAQSQMKEAIYLNIAVVLWYTCTRENEKNGLGVLGGMCL